MAVTVRELRAEDEEQVQLLWYEGFMELPWDVTSTLGKVRTAMNAVSLLIDSQG